MKKNYIILLFLIGTYWYANAQTDVELSQFQMSNITSPAFQLMEETVTDVYTPENVKALALHVQNNFGESLAIEVAPYFFINTKSKSRTYYKYIGVTKENDVLKQNPFSGLNTTTLSFAYLKKDFKNIVGDNDHKTFSIGIRTTLLRFFDKEQIYNNAEKIADELLKIPSPPIQILSMEAGPKKDEAFKKFYLEQQKIEERFKPFQKTIKPIFKLDGALAYSNLFKENSTDGGTVSRFGSWLTGEFNLILNEDDETSTTNNYMSVLAIARYIEDGFNMEVADTYTTSYYRDFGGKVNFEFGKFTFGYEYVKRNGSISSERSVGTISFALDKNISLTGGFGKDFQVTDNLLAIFGINWGLNLGNTSASVAK